MSLKSRTVTLAVSCVIFLSVGMLGAGLGPALPNLASNTGSGLAEIGILVTALFVGAVISQLAGGALTDRFGQRSVLLVSISLFALGLTGVLLSPNLPLAVVAMFVTGLGDGVVIVAVNVAIAQLFASRSVTALNILNIFYGVGATAGPAIASFGLETWDSALVVLWVVAGILVPPALLIMKLDFGPNPSAAASSEHTPVPASIYRSPFLWLLGTLLLLYVGYEVGTGVWTTVYVDRTTTLGLEISALAASGFYLALTGGRMLAAVLGTWLRAEFLLLLATVGTALGSFLMLLSVGNAAATIAAIIVIGFSLGPVYPAVIALTTMNFRNTPGKSTGIVVAMGSVGGTIMPWLQGLILVQMGAVANAVYVVVGSLAMLAAFIAARVLLPRPTAAPLEA
jgi:fucose permease